jgi:hypothetical protein
MPKSSSFTSPSKLTMMLVGETSRCTMPSGRPLRVQALVRVGDAGQHLVHDVKDDRRRQRAVVFLPVARRDLRERAAVDEFLGEVVAVPDLAEIGDGHDVRMRQHGAQLRFVDELRDRLRVQRQCGFSRLMTTIRSNPRRR